MADDRREDRQAGIRSPDHRAGRQAHRHDHGPCTEPNDKGGQAQDLHRCKGDDKDKPIIGLVIIRDLKPDGDRYKGGTILDPEDGKIYKAEVWNEDGKLKVRGYLGVLYKTQTWVKGS